VGGEGGDNTASLTIIQEQEAINRALQTDTHRFSIIYRQIPNACFEFNPHCVSRSGVSVTVCLPDPDP
jgi:hypothetical protein